MSELGLPISFAPPSGFVETNEGGAAYYVKEYYKPFTLTTLAYNYLNDDSYTGFARLAGKVGNLALLIIAPLNLIIVPFTCVANWLKAEYYEPFALTTNTYHFLNNDSYTGPTRLAARVGNIALVVIALTEVIIFPFIFLANELKHFSSYLKIDPNQPFALTTRTYDYLNDDSYSGLTRLAGKVWSLALIFIAPLNLALVALHHLGSWLKTEEYILAKLTVETRTDLTNENPLEFESNLGVEKWNRVRDEIVMNLVSFEWLAKNMSDEEVAAAWCWDRQCGGAPADQRAYIWWARQALARQQQAASQPSRTAPTQDELLAYREKLEGVGRAIDETQTPTFNDLFSADLINTLESDYHIDPNTILHFRRFMQLVGNSRAFRFLRNLPGKLSYYDKVINDAIARAIPGAKKPIVASTVPLMNRHNASAPHPTYEDLSARLVREMFTVAPGNQPLNVSPEKVAETVAVFETQGGTSNLNNQQILEQIESLFDFEDNLGIDHAEFRELLKGFCTSDGLKLIYCLYHLLDLKLVTDAGQLKDLDGLKEHFAICPLSRPLLRSLLTKQQLGGGSTTVQLEGENGEVATLFSQETDQATITALTDLNTGLFHPVNQQIQPDRNFDALVFLNKKVWDPNYVVLPIAPLADGTVYPAHDRKRVTVIAARELKTGRWFMLMCGHGDSQNAEDGRRQVRHMMATYEAFAQQYPGIIPMIGTNGNTKTNRDLQAFATTVNELRLQQLPDAIANARKCRLHSIQAKKVGKGEISRSSNLAIANNPRVRLANESTLFGGFPHPNIQQLPSVYHPSDQLPIRTTIELAC